MAGSYAEPTLPFAPEPGSVQTLLVHADYFVGQIDLKQFRATHPHYPVLGSDPLIIELVRGSFAIMTKFGAVVTWNCPRPQAEDLLRDVAGLPGALRLDERVRDDLAVQVGRSEARVTFDEIHLKELGIERLKIISLALAQSVALEHFEIAVDEAMRHISPVVTALRAQGSLISSEREVLRAVGFALDVRAAVLANLTLFDKPPEAWESEALDRLDNQLYDHFDLEERLSAINQKVQFLTDFNATLMDVLNHRKSVRLEWIVILLILIECIFFVWVELKK